MKNIIKKIICSLCLGMIMTGCSGVTDYRIILNNDYYIAKTSANNAKIFKIEDKDITGRAPSIPVYNKENDEEYEKAMKALKLEEEKIEHNISELPGKEDTIWF